MTASPRLGVFLRRSSIDELPQLFNVLCGEMALVGPRPHAVTHNIYYTGKVRAYMARHRLKPGITGLAQITGHRGETQTLEKCSSASPRTSTTSTNGRCGSISRFWSRPLLRCSQKIFIEVSGNDRPGINRPLRTHSAGRQQGIFPSSILRLSAVCSTDTRRPSPIFLRRHADVNLHVAHHRPHDRPGQLRLHVHRRLCVQLRRETRQAPLFLSVPGKPNWTCSSTRSRLATRR